MKVHLQSINEFKKQKSGLHCADIIRTLSTNEQSIIYKLKVDNFKHVIILHLKTTKFYQSIKKKKKKLVKIVNYIVNMSLNDKWQMLVF